MPAIASKLGMTPETLRIDLGRPVADPHHVGDVASAIDVALWLALGASRVPATGQLTPEFSSALDVGDW